MDLPSNSHSAQPLPPVEKNENLKKVEKIVTGEVGRRKKGLGRRFLETFFGGDAKSAVMYVVTDVLLPATKDAIADAFSQGIERMLFGENRHSSRRHGHRSGNPNYTSYNRYSQPSSQSSGRREEPRNISRRGRESHDFDEILLQTRVEADEVLSGLYDLLERYEMISVSDLYNMVGITPSYTDEKWGWTSLQGSSVSRDRGGRYILNLPPTEQLV